MKPPPDQTHATDPAMTDGMLPTIAGTEKGDERGDATVEPTVAATRAYDPSQFEGPAPAHSGPPTDIAPPSSGHSTGGSRRGIVGRIEAGQTLYGKYEVLSRLGGGAMGDVWLVRHLILKAERALKVIIPNFATNAVALMRFQREFEIMASLRHEHAVSIYDAALDDDGGYIEMEYVEGQTLFDVLTEARPRQLADPSNPLMPLEWVDRVLEQLCEVLHAAHEKHIIHRDLKPANMMLLGGRKPGKEYLKVLDFGIAKIRDDPDSLVKQGAAADMTHGFIGTPSYGSPEQATSRPDIDGRADIYCVGVMLYEIVSGRLPFKGHHLQIMNQHAYAAAPPFSEVNPSLRPMPEVEYAILRALSKDPAHRPQTARELYEDVHRAIVEMGEDFGAGPAVARPLLPRPVPPPLTEFDGRDTQVPGWARVEQSTLVAEPEPESEPEKTIEPAPEAAKGQGRWVLLAAGLAVTVVVAALSVFLVVKLGLLKPSSSGKSLSPPTVTGGSGTGGTSAGSSRDYLPPGFEPVEGYSDGDSPWPGKIERKADGVTFNLLSGSNGSYLPEGYQAETSGDLASDGWPRVIYRPADLVKARYLRIVGEKGWTMGSLEPSDVAADRPGHLVKLASFYMGETEVTNDQFDAYLRSKKVVPPSSWKTAWDKVQKADPKNFGDHPAADVPRKLADNYARSARGLLPTEAQWEYAAKSEGQAFRYVWGNDEPNRLLANNGMGETAQSAPVRFYPKDRTAQGIFDLGGNLSEWCRDGWQEGYKLGATAEIDPCGVVANPDNPEYAVRGPSYLSLDDEQPTTHRSHQPGEVSEVQVREFLGFRIVIECPDARKPRR